MENLFDNNSKCQDRECDSAYVKHRSKSVFDKSSDKEMSSSDKETFCIERLRISAQYRVQFESRRVARSRRF